MPADERVALTEQERARFANWCEAQARTYDGLAKKAEFKIVEPTGLSMRRNAAAFRVVLSFLRDAEVVVLRDEHG